MDNLVCLQNAMIIQRKSMMRTRANGDKRLSFSSTTFKITSLANPTQVSQYNCKQNYYRQQM